MNKNGHRPQSNTDCLKTRDQASRLQPAEFCSVAGGHVEQTVKKITMAVQTEPDKESLRIPTKFYRIGELINCTPFSRQTIHNYTIMGLIREARWTEGGHRLYDESVFERLSEILQLRKTNTLSQIREILSKRERSG